MWARLAVYVAFLVGLAPAAWATCPDTIASRFPFLPAAWRIAQASEQVPPGGVARGSVRLTFIGHASFLIESPMEVKAVTDYTDFVPIDFVPDIITMNHFHPTHYSDNPDPRIPHVLRGWNPKGGVPRINLQVRDMRVFNIQTNYGEFGDFGRNENSIFVFEAAGMCVAHLSHTHHTLSKEDLAALGDIDVLLVPVDGMYTVSEEEVFELHCQGEAEAGDPLALQLLDADLHRRRREALSDHACQQPDHHLLENVAARQDRDRVPGRDREDPRLAGLRRRQPSSLSRAAGRTRLRRERDHGRDQAVQSARARLA